jgi:hypothetical protein
VLLELVERFVRDVLGHAKTGMSDPVRDPPADPSGRHTIAGDVPQELLGLILDRGGVPGRHGGGKERAPLFLFG